MSLVINGQYMANNNDALLKETLNGVRNLHLYGKEMVLKNFEVASNALLPYHAGLLATSLNMPFSDREVALSEVAISKWSELGNGLCVTDDGEYVTRNADLIRHFMGRYAEEALQQLEVEKSDILSGHLPVACFNLLPNGNFVFSRFLLLEGKELRDVLPYYLLLLQANKLLRTVKESICDWHIQGRVHKVTLLPKYTPRGTKVGYDNLQPRILHVVDTRSNGSILEVPLFSVSQAVPSA